MDELMDISYVRLSKEDGDVEDGSIDESCSIQSQRNNDEPSRNESTDKVGRIRESADDYCA